MAPPPHFHSKDQLLTAFHAAVTAFNAEYAECTEPTRLSVRVRLPDGSVSVLATVSVQPTKKRRTAKGEDWGGYHGHLLFKRPETGAVSCIRSLLEEDAKLLGAVSAVHGKSQSGAAITNVAHLAESLADKAWGSMSAADRLPWHEAAELSKRQLNAVSWGKLEGALDDCKGFARFVDSLKALGNTVGTPEHNLSAVRQQPQLHKDKLADLDD